MSDGTDSFEADVQGFPVSSDRENLRGRLPVELLASQFVDEMRAGLQPTIDQYASRYTRLADEIREFFPVLLAMEELKQKKRNDNLRDSVPERFDLRKLGDCYMLSEIGRGGMGVVFQAVEGGGRRVAVKVLPWHTAGIAGWRERFEREADTMRKLRHPNIVPIYRFGQEGGYCYYVMQLVVGVGLDWLIARLHANNVVPSADVRAAGHMRRKVQDIDTDCEIPIELLEELEDADTSDSAVPARAEPLTLHSWRQFARIIQQSARALGYAHRRGVLHNDVKPGNLLVSDNWDVWMTDFGLAQRLDSSSGQDERLVGTLRYMAPERVCGDQTVQSDVYSLGVTMYELVTQTPAFANGVRDDLVQRILQQEPPRPRDINYAIPSELETIILNAISPDPAQRYSTAAAFEADLTRFLAGQPICSLRDASSRFGLFRKTRPNSQ